MAGNGEVNCRMVPKNYAWDFKKHEWVENAEHDLAKGIYTDVNINGMTPATFKAVANLYIADYFNNSTDENFDASDVADWEFVPRFAGRFATLESFCHPNMFSDEPLDGTTQVAGGALAGAGVGTIIVAVLAGIFTEGLGTIAVLGTVGGGAAVGGTVGYAIDPDHAEEQGYLMEALLNFLYNAYADNVTLLGEFANLAEGGRNIIQNLGHEDKEFVRTYFDKIQENFVADGGAACGIEGLLDRFVQLDMNETALVKALNAMALEGQDTEMKDLLLAYYYKMKGDDETAQKYMNNVVNNCAESKTGLDHLTPGRRRIAEFILGIVPMPITPPPAAVEPAPAPAPATETEPAPVKEIKEETPPPSKPEISEEEKAKRRAAWKKRQAKKRAEEARKKAEEEAARKAREEAEAEARRQREAEARRQREAERRAREAERRRQEEAARKAREEAAKKKKTRKVPKF